MATDPTRGMFLQDRSYRYLVAFLPFALVGAVVAAMDPLALAVVLALPLIPFAMFALIKGMTGDKAYGAGPQLKWTFMGEPISALERMTTRTSISRWR